MNSSTPIPFEMAFRQYLAIFNGTPKRFSDFEPLFDKLYHNQLYLEDENGPLSRKKVKAYHAQLLAAGWKAELIHFRRVGLNQFDVKFRFVTNGGEEQETIHKHITTIERKIAKVQNIDGTLRSLIKAQGKATYYNMSKIAVPVGQ
ncbi:hypothetical protein ACHAXM_004446 [Skeletonema potamos]|jgi:hypothetical protein